MSDFRHAVMKAAVVRAFDRPLSIEEVPVPVTGPRQLLVRIVASGVCHSDVHAVEGDWPVRPRLPFIPGHEAVGDVVAIGGEVDGFAIGERVGVPWLYAACGHCEYCQSGRESLCPQQLDTGWQVNGGFAEYVVANVDYVARIPEALDPFAAAPILGAGLTVYKGLKETETTPGQWVVISGIGGLGHLALQYARAMGLRPIAIDVDAAKLTLAQACGAEVCVDATRPDLVASVLEETGGAHAALVTADAPDAFGTALQMLRSGGTCVLLGMPPGNVPMPVYPVVTRRLTVRGSIEGTRSDLVEALDFAARGLVQVTREVRRLEEINDVFARLRTGRVLGRIVLDLRRPVPQGKARNEARELTSV